MLTDKVKAILKPLDDDVTLIITIGNSFRSDDGIGPYIFEKLVNLAKNIVKINAEDKPENIIDQAISVMPKKTIIIDAANFNGKIGEARVISNEHISDSTLSTHTFPPNIIAKLIENDTGSKVFFLGIQPKTLEFGEKITDKVKKTGDEITLFVNSGLQPTVL